MLVNSQGFGHFLNNLNNQDYFLETSRMLLVLDGCSGAKFSEVGTRLFAQLFSRKEGYDSLENFECNVKETFNELVESMSKYYQTTEEFENDFILENLMFTIIACFETDDKYVVKMFGDGYIITQNYKDKLSYMKFSYGKCPPYMAYRYCKFLEPNVFKDYEFKTFEFDKKLFKGIGIASDGILPIVKGNIDGADEQIIRRNSAGLLFRIQSQNKEFLDDVTLIFFDKTAHVVDKAEENITPVVKENASQKAEAMIKRVDEMDAIEAALFGEKIVAPTKVESKVDDIPAEAVTADIPEEGVVILECEEGRVIAKPIIDYVSEEVGEKKNLEE